MKIKSLNLWVVGFVCTFQFVFANVFISDANEITLDVSSDGIIGTPTTENTQLSKSSTQEGEKEPLSAIDSKIKPEEIEKSTRSKSASESSSDDTKIALFFEKNSFYEFPTIDVSPSSENVFSTPVTWFNGSIYTVDIEPPDGKNNGINLKTVVRKWTLNKTGDWSWVSNVVEDRTLDDRYHTQASIAVDKNGYIHVVYNMHNMPWQYKVSKKPEDISKFNFLGEEISTDTLMLVKHENKTPFPNIGTAAIPGTQVTYPAFFKDRNDDLYVTYRFATRPAQPWENRGFAGGIAKYDALRKTWSSIGGEMTLTEDDAVFPASTLSSAMKINPFAYYNDWSVYLIRLAFDKSNAMHVSWTWREGGAGSDCSDPSYAFSSDGSGFTKSDGQKYKLHVAVTDTDKIHPDSNSLKFYSSTSLSTDTSGNPYIVLNPVGSSRCLMHYDQSAKGWSDPQSTPWGATEIYIDDDDRQWAFSSGPNVFYRDKGTTKWTHAFASEDFGWPKIHYVDELGGFLIHTLYTKDRTKSKLFWISRAVKK